MSYSDRTDLPAEVFVKIAHEKVANLVRVRQSFVKNVISSWAGEETNEINLDELVRPFFPFRELREVVAAARIYRPTTLDNFYALQEQPDAGSYTYERALYDRETYVCALEGDVVRFFPEISPGEMLQFNYVTDFLSPEMDGANAHNFILRDNGHVYLYQVLREAAKFVGDFADAASYRSEFIEAVSEINYREKQSGGRIEFTPHLPSERVIV